MLLFVLWYCHKRGREVRLEKEASKVVDAAKEPEPPVVVKTGSREEPIADVAESSSGMPQPPIGPDVRK